MFAINAPNVHEEKNVTTVDAVTDAKTASTRMPPVGKLYHFAAVPSPTKVSKFYQLAVQAKKTAEKYKKFNELNGVDYSQNVFNKILAKPPKIFEKAVAKADAVVNLMTSARMIAEKYRNAPNVQEDKAVTKADVVNMNSYFDQLMPLFDQDLMKKCDADNDVDNADICDMEAFIESLRPTPSALRPSPTVKFSTEDCAKADRDEVKVKKKMKRNNLSLESCFGFEGEHDFENGFDGESVEQMIMDGIIAESMIDDQDSDEDIPEGYIIRHAAYVNEDEM